jgi:hypothetical protein
VGWNTTWNFRQPKLRLSFELIGNSKKNFSDGGAVNWLERWLVRYLVTRACRYGGNTGMPVFYTEIRKTIAKLYWEDNIPSLNYSLRNWFDKSLQKTAWDILQEKDIA